jgi:hypothetical protein
MSLIQCTRENTAHEGRAICRVSACHTFEFTSSDPFPSHSVDPSAFDDGVLECSFVHAHDFACRPNAGEGDHDL